MSNLEKFKGEIVEQNTPAIGEPVTYEGENTVNVVLAIQRRWYLVLLVFIVMCAIGIPVIWLGIKPVYNVTGAIRVAPIISNILTGEADSGEISNYRSFVNTQASMIISGKVVERVADELVEKKISFLKKNSSDIQTKLKQELKGKIVSLEPATLLRYAINNGVISASADRNTELIKVTMESVDAEEAKQIVNTFIKNYMAVEGSSSAQDEDRNLRVLEDERKVLSETLERQRNAIQKLAQEYGSTTLTGRQDMMLDRVSFLLGELTEVEAERIKLEALIQQLEQNKDETINNEQSLNIRKKYINSDLIVQELNKTIVDLKKEYIVSKQLYAPTNPELKYQKQVIEELQKALEQEKERLRKDFDENIQSQMIGTNQEKLFNVRVELDQIKAYEQRLREKISSEDAQAIRLGRKQLAIKDLQDQLMLTKEMYSTIQRRIKELEMERKRPARVSVAYNAEISFIKDKRTKFSAALILGSLACGIMLAFLRDKMDKSLRTPEDVTKQIGIRIIGTTSNLSTMEQSLMSNQVVEDYQSIRANLGFLNGEELPKKLVITSPGMKEGKTTCSVNLANSMSESGKKVLLIDGDLRKPNVHKLLHVPKGFMSVQNMLVGQNGDSAIYTVNSTGLDVLVADAHERLDVYELLAIPASSQNTEKISLNYDHVIIDTPPVLAFPDALIWAKMADAVVLTSFAGKTTASDLKEAKNKLTNINVKILGIVLSNVSMENSYYRYSYNYYTQNDTKKRTKSIDSKLLLMPDNESTNSDANES